MGMEREEEGMEFVGLMLDVGERRKDCVAEGNGWEGFRTLDKAFAAGVEHRSWAWVVGEPITDGLGL